MSDAVEGLFQPVFTTNPTVEGTGLGQSIRDDIRIAAAPASDPFM
jgi:C4-dicarboxylate-specific signal transduction histidine kinase